MGQTPFYRTSNELEHHFSNIERTRTCSFIVDRTRIPEFWLQIRGGTSHGSARISARARKFWERILLGSLGLGNFWWDLGSARSSSAIYQAWLGSFFKPKNEPNSSQNLARFGSFLAHLKIKLKQVLSVILNNLCWNWHIELTFHMIWKSKQLQVMTSFFSSLSLSSKNSSFS